MKSLFNYFVHSILSGTNALFKYLAGRCEFQVERVLFLGVEFNGEKIEILMSVFDGFKGFVNEEKYALGVISKILWFVL